MRRVAAATIGGGLLVAVALVAGSLASRVPAAEPSAAEIVARSVAARGGLEAWRKVETMVWSGHVESVHAPVPNLRFELLQMRPNKTRLQMQVPGGGQSVRVFDGARGWKVRAAAGGRPDLQPFTPQELTFARAGHGIDGPLLDHAAKGDPLTLAGVDEVAGGKAFHLVAQLAKGGKEDVWVDAKTFLEVRYDRMADGPTPGASRRVSVTYGDYRTVEGLTIPFLIETGVGSGTTPDKMQIDKVVLNAPLDGSTFSNPAKVPPRQRGGPGGPTPALTVSPSTTPTASSGAPGRAPP
jgi:hypothetical protein